MKVVLFDLGNTLEDTLRGVLLPGALETLKAVSAMQDSAGVAPALALASDFGELGSTPEQVAAAQAEYYAILDGLGIRQFFEPVAQRVILSAEVGAEKPDRKVFQAVIDRLDPSLTFRDLFFVTERRAHILAARALCMRAVHFKGPGETTGEVTRLADLIPLVQTFLQGAG